MYALTDWIIIDYDIINIICYNHNRNVYVKLPQKANKLTDLNNFLNQQLEKVCASGKTSCPLDITLVMTHKCNLRCDYCFENNIQRNKISIDVGNTLAYLHKLIHAFKSSEVIIRFFGGEPLIEIEKIIEISTELRTIHKEVAFTFVAFTNAYLLSETNILKLYDAGLKEIHTSLDGDELTHDLHKRTPTGEGTFQVIKKNIEMTLRYFNVNLRLNISKATPHKKTSAKKVVKW